jgi:hypothetical protein
MAKHTIKGHINILYHRVKDPKHRGLDPVDYTEKELTKWLLKKGYVKMFKKWRKAKWDTLLFPSIDRLDTEKNYALDNIELVTWKENLKRLYRDRKAGVGRPGQDNRVIVAVYPDGTAEKYLSISAASRKTGVNRGNINTALAPDSRLKTAGGITWVYEEDYKNNRYVKMVSMEESAFTHW